MLHPLRIDRRRARGGGHHQQHRTCSATPAGAHRAAARRGDRRGNVAWTRIPFRQVRLLLELRADHELLRQVFRILNHRGHDEPRPVLRQREAVEEFLHDRTLAVGHAVRTQVAGGEVRRHDFERAAARRATAEDPAILRLPEPPRLGMPLQRSRAGRSRSSEVEAARLLPASDSITSVESFSHRMRSRPGWRINPGGPNALHRWPPARSAFRSHASATFRPAGFGTLAVSPFGGVTIRHRQSSVITETHCPVRSINAPSRGLPIAPPRPCPMAGSDIAVAISTPRTTGNDEPQRNYQPAERHGFALRRSR